VSNRGAGAMLTQQQEGLEHVLEYYSKSFNAAERNYCVTRRKLLADVLSIHIWPEILAAHGPLVSPMAV